MPWRKGGRLKLVREAEASGRLPDIYAEIKQGLGVPHVNVMFQAFAAYPKFLDLHWKAMRPLLETQEFFVAAARLEADAYTRMHNYFDVPDLSGRVRQAALSDGARNELSRMVELFQYNNPPLLLMAVTQLQAFDGKVGQPGTARRPADHPVFLEKPRLVEEDSASPRIQTVYEDIKRTLQLPFADADYRALGRWPDFLEAYWNALKPIAESPLYGETRFHVRATAWTLSRELPVPVELTVGQLLEAGLKDEDVAALVRITELFVYALACLLLNIAVAKIGLEGGTRKRTTPEVPEPKASERPSAA